MGKIDGTVELPTAQAELLSAIGKVCILIRKSDFGHLRERVFLQHSWRWENGGLYDQNLFTRPLKSSFIGDNEELRSKDVKAREALEARYAGKGLNCSFWPINMWGLCSGKNIHRGVASAALFCWLEFKAHKIFTVGPLKVEFLSRNPDIVQIYDAFSNVKVSADISNRTDSMSSIEAVIASGLSYGASALAKGGEHFITSEFLAGAPRHIQVDAVSRKQDVSMDVQFQQMHCKNFLSVTATGNHESP